MIRFIRLCALWLFLAPAAALALDVSSPNVEQYMLDIKLKNRFDYDHRPAENGYRSHSLAVSYGFTEWLALELGGDWKKNSGDGYAFSATKLKSILQFTEPGEYWVDVGGELGFERASQQGEADAITSAILLGKTISRAVVLVNLDASHPVGAHADANPEFSWSALARYSLHPAFNPALEYYADMGSISDMGGYGEQKHRLGPAFSGKLAPGLKYDAGWLMAVSDRAEDHLIKINFKYSLPY